MDREKRREGYLEQAKAAEEKAVKAIDATEREGWEKVAKGFRDLARQT